MLMDMKRPHKNPHAVALGRLGGRAAMDAMSEKEKKEFHSKGGKVGGKTRSEKLTPEQRSAIARKAALARHGKKAGKV